MKVTFIASITFILLEQKLEFHKKICENKGFHVSHWSLINIENTIKIKNTIKLLLFTHISNL